jgi:5-(carboxyamino)imidazole ribonucleotide mutase
MGSDSDLQIMNGAAEMLDIFKIPYEITIVSAHRTTKRMVTYARQAKGRGLKVIIAGAGGAAHLPGIVASITPLPVIGVPIKTTSLDGLDSLLSIVQMPSGIPVATVAINGAKNAGILAAEILGISSPIISNSVRKYRQNLESEVLRKALSLEKIGAKKYLERTAKGMHKK